MKRIVPINLIPINLIISLIVVLFFYFEFDLNIRSVFVHLIVIGYYFSLLYLTTLIIVRFLPKLWSISLNLILIIVSECLLLFLYLSYYFSIENWGLPLTFDMVYAYSDEFIPLVESMAISKGIIITIMLFVLGTIITFLFWRIKKAYPKLQQTSMLFFKDKPILKLVGIGLLFSLSMACYFIGGLKEKALYHGRKDPVLAFFLFQVQGDIQVTESGINTFEEKNKYPTNLEFNKKNVILMICDALRYDHLGMSGYKRTTSPFLDSIASNDNALSISNFYSTSSRSFFGITNILSSDYNVRYNNFYIHDLLKKQGYHINFILSGDHTNFCGLKQYYGKSIDTYYDGILAKARNSSSIINDDKRVVLDKLREFPKFNNIPSFFYLHFMTAHQLGVLNPAFHVFKPNKVNFQSNSHDSEAITNNYDNKVTQLDHYLKKTFSILKEKGYLENTIIVITADHGQSLGEKGNYWHAKSTYMSETSVPFIIIETGKSDQKLEHVSGISNQLDIIPTIVDLLHIPQPKTWKGGSILKKRNLNYIYQQEKQYYSVIWLSEEIKYQYIYNKKTGKEELFNLNKDYAQKTNLIKSFSQNEILQRRKQIEKFYSIKIK